MMRIYFPGKNAQIIFLFFSKHVIASFLLQGLGYRLWGKGIPFRPVQSRDKAITREVQWGGEAITRQVQRRDEAITRPAQSRDEAITRQVQSRGEAITRPVPWEEAITRPVQIVMAVHPTSTGKLLWVYNSSVTSDMSLKERKKIFVSVNGS